MKKTTSIAIGGFDGIHIGHQALFNELDDNGTIAVINTGYANLTPKEYRKNIQIIKFCIWNLMIFAILTGKDLLLFCRRNSLICKK